MSKFDDEMKGVGTALKNTWWWLVYEFDNPFARQVVFFVKTLGKSEPLLWFMFGIAVEALGLGVQAMLAMDIYPLLDFLVAGIVVTILYVYQNRGKKVAQCV